MTTAFWHHKLDLNRPLPVQYLLFLRSIVTLNFGESISFQQPVTELIGSRISTTLALMGFSLLISIVGIDSARDHRGATGEPCDGSFAQGLDDGDVRDAALLDRGWAWCGTSTLKRRSGRLCLGLGQGFGPYVESLILPSVTIALFTAPVLFRSLRATMVDMFQAEHVVAARARGLSEPRILRRYVLRNSLTSTVTMLGLTIGSLIAGHRSRRERLRVAWPGQSDRFSDRGADFPVIRVLVLLIGVWVILANLLADLANAWLNPQVRA